MECDERRCKLGVCGEVLTQKEGETKANFESREFCGRSCSTEWLNLMRIIGKNKRR